MKWLRGGWSRADWVDPQQRTMQQRTMPAGQQDSTGTRRYTSEHGQQPDQPRPAGLLSPQARDVDVSAAGFRMLLVGGGLSGLMTVLCAATLTYKGNSVGMWLWQLLFGVLFLWFVNATRGMLNGRGFLLDHSGFYVRTRGEVFGVPWQEIGAIGVGTLPWVEHRRPVHPERRVALEFYPTDPGFADRHPEWERWRVTEPPSIAGTPGERYRFHLPPFSRLPKTLEGAVRGIVPRKWIGQYRREQPPTQE